jgi:hypothetical protein
MKEQSTCDKNNLEKNFYGILGCYFKSLLLNSDGNVQKLRQLG